MTRGCYLGGGWMVVREEAGDKYSSLMVSLLDVHDKLVEAEEMLVLALQGRKGYSQLVGVQEVFELAPLQGMEVERELVADFGLLLLHIARCPRN